MENKKKLMAQFANITALDNAAMHCIKGGDEEVAALVIDNGSGMMSAG